MNKRLVVTSEVGRVKLTDLRTFLATLEKHGVSITTGTAEYHVDEQGNLRFWTEIPEDQKVVGRRVIRIRGRDKRRRAIDAQLAQHREDKKNGTAEGYVPPVGRTKPPVPKKMKCPRCGIRKPIQTINGLRLLKPHTKAGENCPGSGIQVGVARVKGTK